MLSQGRGSRAKGTLTVLISAGLLAGFAWILAMPGHAFAAVGPTVKSGPLTAVVGKGSWSFSLHERRRGRILVERPGTGASGVGRIGIRDAAGGWHRATRVVRQGRKGRASISVVALKGAPQQLRIEVAPGRGGIMRLEASVIGSADGIEAIGMGFRTRRGERYMGFGERSNRVDQRGREVESWVGEGPYQAEESDVIKGFVPRWSVRAREDDTYFPMPWLLSSHGYGVLARETRPTYFRLGNEREDTWSVEVARTVPGLDRQPEDRPSPTVLRLNFFAGPTPAATLTRLTRAIGRQPDPAPWFLGPWVQAQGGDQNTVDTLQRADVPTSVTQTYSHYLPCGHHLGDYSNEVRQAALYHANGMAVTTYFNPMICIDWSPKFDQVAAAGGLTRNREGDPYAYRYMSYDVGQFDFSAAAGRFEYGELLRQALGHGFDGWMEDFGEYDPPDGISADGSAGMVSHNRYPRDYHCTAQDEVASDPRPVLRYVRSGYTGSAACSPVVWGGDPTTGWDFDGLTSAVTNGLTAGLSGIGLWGSDIGGFFTLGAATTTPELLKRWVQLGAFSGVMRDQADGFALHGRSRARIFDADQIDHWRRYAKLRTQLYPYIRAASREYRRTGMPLMRAMVLQYPGDRRSSGRFDQFMFGRDLLVAPVTAPGVTERKVALPPGLWIDLWKTVGYDPEDGSFPLKRAARVRGGAERTVAAGEDDIPVMVRAGALLPMVPPSVDTLSPYGAANPDVSRLYDQPARSLLAFPRGATATAFDQGSIRSAESRRGPRKWTLRIRDHRPRTWTVRASLTSLKRPFRPRCLAVNGKAGKGWRYDHASRTIEFEIRSRRGRTTVVIGTCRR